MKIAFTAKGKSWDAAMDHRFGRMEMLVLYDEEGDEIHDISNKEVEAMEHGAGLQTAKKVMELHPDVVIAGNGPGQKAQELLKRSHIKMYVGAGDMTIKEAYEAYKADKLTPF